MTNIRRALEAAAAVGGAGEYVEDVFSTYLYTGDGGTQTITNGIDLSGEGGMVWGKGRNVGRDNILTDTVRGASQTLVSNSDAASSDDSPNYLSAFNSDGFEVKGANALNASGQTTVGWTFREAPGFFDVVTYTGDDVAGRTVAHNLESVPGCIIVKSTSDAENWRVYHRSLGATKALQLNSTSGASTSILYWNDTAPTSTEFSVGAYDGVNGSGKTYVAYLFAHDDQIFGAGSDESIIACGGYTGNSGTLAISLGWEAQYVMLKKSSNISNWIIFDAMRGVITGGADCELDANTTAAEDCGNEYLSFAADGFQLDGGNMNNSGDEYIYIAIRRPMKAPAAGTEVFGVDTRGRLNTDVPGFDTTFPIVDLAIVNALSGGSFATSTRLTGTSVVYTNTTATAGTSSNAKFDYMNGWYNFAGTDADQISWMFKRVSKFMDIVCYAGNTISGHTIDHNLGVVPEMMITKTRTAGYTRGWAVYHKDVYPSGDMSLFLNTDQAETADGVYYPTTPTATSYTVGTDAHVNNASNTYNAYLWATLAGVSKVGSYTADATLTTINCGFSAGARFILIKRFDAVGDWYFWDYFRGIVAGNDPYMLLNDSAAQVTGTDYIDPDNSGFQITAAGSSTINIDTGEYIFLAIA